MPAQERRREWIRLDVLVKATGYSVDEIRTRVARGKLPRPSYHFGYLSPVWDRDQLTAWLGAKASQRLPPARRQSIPDAAA
ncbi:MAG TPA: hypothetical protein VME92_02865 [Acetobacteraceae bacterium]|nr:hypothetical protein [Acetobacteraceae bacterium]